MTIFRSWLPADTAMPPLAQGALADMADGWSREWFAGEPLRVLGAFARIAEPRGELRKTVWHVCEGGLAIGAPQHLAASLGAHVLGVPLAAERPAADTRLLEQVGRDCLGDLKRRAAASLRLAKDAAWRESEAGCGGAVHRLDIATPARTIVLTLELSADLFARFVKAAFAEPPPLAPLGAAGQALAPLPVDVSAVLGRCGLSVAELSGLAEGDVLVLDRQLDARLPLAVGGREVRRGSCTLSEHGSSVALNITESLSG